MAGVSTYRKVIATTLSTDFRKACQIVTASIPKLKENEVLVKAKYAGINATDINLSAGRYMKPGDSLPLAMGGEGVGEVVDVGSAIPAAMKGTAVGYMYTGSYGEYLRMPAKVCLPLPAADPKYIPLMVSGLTAAISLDQLGRMKKGETVFVSAAAGGTGHLAVQLAKQAGCHVIGTCSTKDKEDFLKSIGCDHVINYKEQNLREVLKASYPKGIDVVYESIGGNVFDACLSSLAVKGRMIVIGYIETYHSPSGLSRSNRNATLITKLLMKSTSVCGFYLMNHASDFKHYIPKLVNMLDSGALQVHIEQADDKGKKFSGLESVYDAIDYLYSRNSKGKIILEIENNDDGTVQSKL